MKKTGALLLACAAVLAAVLTGCGSDAQDPELNGTTDPAQQVQTEPAEDLNVCAVETPYGTLYYQEQWSEFMRTEATQRGDAYEVNFQAEINEKRYSLFTVTINDPEADPVRQLTDADGVQHGVSVEVEEYLDVSDLDEGNQALIYAIQEDINFIIDKIK